MIKNDSPDTNPLPDTGMTTNGGIATNALSRQRFLGDQPTRLVTRNHIRPETMSSHEELWATVQHHWTTIKRKDPGTIQKYLNYIKKAGQHPVVPINWLQPDPDQILAHLDYIEHQEKTPVWHIKNTRRAFWAILEMMGYNPGLWGYTDPIAPPARMLILPSPDQVKTLFKAPYAPGYLGVFTRHLLYAGFFIGSRPGELVTIRCSDVYPTEGYLIVHEHKKHGRAKQIFLPNDVIARSQRQSIRHYIDHIRPESESDMLWLQENGRPWTTAYMRKTIHPLVQAVWSPFCFTTMRDWLATATVIRSKVESGAFEVREAQWQLGHGKTDSIEHYIGFAKQYYRRYPYDWLSYVLKPAISMRGGKRRAAGGSTPENRLIPQSQQEERGTGLEGFEPTASRLRADCSNLAELQALPGVKPWWETLTAL